MTTTTTFATLAVSIRNAAANMGLQLMTGDTLSGMPENGGYFFVSIGGGHSDSSRGVTGSCLIISKAKTVFRCDSHVSIPGWNHGIANGRVVCQRMNVTLSDISMALSYLALTSERRPLGATQKKVIGVSSKETGKLLSTADVNPFLAELSPEELELLAPMPEFSQADFDDELQMYSSAK